MSCQVYIPSRALPDIKSSPEVQQIFKIRNFRKPDVFLPLRWTFENSKKIQKKKKIQFRFPIFFFQFFFFFNFFSDFFLWSPQDRFFQVRVPSMDFFSDFFFTIN